MIKIPVFPGDPRKNDGLFVFGAALPKPFVFAYAQQETEIVHGPSCKPDNEIEVDKCVNEKIMISPRRGGGGTVVLSPGMLITLVVGERNRNESAVEIFNRIHKSLVTLLGITGIKNIEFSGISDLAINNKKILGSSLYLGNDPLLYYYQSSLMIDSDVSLISRYLKHPPREPDYRQKRCHDDFCTTLKNEGYALTAKSIAPLIQTKLAGFLNEQEF